MAQDKDIQVSQREVYLRAQSAVVSALFGMPYRYDVPLKGGVLPLFFGEKVHDIPQLLERFAALPEEASADDALMVAYECVGLDGVMTLEDLWESSQNLAVLAQNARVASLTSPRMISREMYLNGVEGE